MTDNMDAWGMDSTLRAAARRSAKIVAPLPDCRTCCAFMSNGSYHSCLRGHASECVNASEYQPLPPVRLWRKT